MPVAVVSLTISMVLAAVMGGIMLCAAPVAAGENAAHTLADKFSRAAGAAKKADAERKHAAKHDLQQRRKAEARRKAYEEDMLARARAEAMSRRAKDIHLANESARTEEERKSKAARLAKEVEQKRRAAKAIRLVKEAEEKQLGKGARDAAEERVALEGLRAQQARRIIRKFQRARVQRFREANTRMKNGLGGPRPPLAELDAIQPNEDFIATNYPARVTVLLIVEPRRRGWRRYKEGAYPVLCVGARCYISAGAETTADALPRRRALGPRNSLGRRAGSCNNKLRCVFRGITLDENSPYIQPIDMGLLRHRRRDIRKAEPDRTCIVANGSLHCTAVIIAHHYRAWIVPEAIAEQAGPEALENALYNGLTVTRSARLVTGRAP